MGTGIPVGIQDVYKRQVLPEQGDIRIENVSFSYDGANRDYVLDDVSLHIPQHKVCLLYTSSQKKEKKLLLYGVNGVSG